MFGIEVREYVYKGYMDEFKDRYIPFQELYRTVKAANKAARLTLKNILKDLKNDYGVAKKEFNIKDELRENRRFIEICYKGDYIEIEISIEVVKFTIKG